MKCVWIIFAFVFLFYSVSTEEISLLIVNGENATIEEYPFMAGIFNFGVHTCGGAIINSRSVLTAAHCILSTIPGSVSVSVGSSRRLGQGGTSHRSIRVLIHPEYRYVPEPFFITADVAIVRTVSQIRFSPTVQPVPLGTEPVPSQSPVTAIGWGMMGDNFWSDRADQLQKLEMTSIPNLLCSLMHIGTEAQGVVTSEKICLVAPNNAGVCGGDSGGPILNSRGQTVGIACWTVRPCGSHPSVYIRISSHLRWIQQYV